MIYPQLIPAIYEKNTCRPWFQWCNNEVSQSNTL